MRKVYIALLMAGGAYLLLNWLAAPVVCNPISQSNEDCLDCHADPDEVGEDLVVSEEAFAAGPHGASGGVSCADCHAASGDHIDDPANPPGRASCAQCHSEVIEQLQGSVHAAGRIERAASACTDCHGHAHEISAESAVAQTKLCAQCHEDEAEEFQFGAHSNRKISDVNVGCSSCHGIHDILPSADPQSPTHEYNQPRVCAQCHEAGLTADYAGSVHGRALLEDRGGPTCSTCHDSHHTMLASLERNQEFKLKILAVCAYCHENIYQTWRQSIHGVAYEQKGVYESACCSCCHASHEFIRPEIGSGVPLQTRIIRECAHCHANERLIRRFNWPQELVQTYEVSYHGRATDLGDSRVANCSSCHQHHAIFSPEDERSSVHPSNLQQTCGGADCHPGATENFISGTRVHHYRESQVDNYWAWFVGNTYVWMIVLIIGGMVVHNAMDFTRKMIIRSRQHQSEQHVIRMTALERLMHGTVAISFIGLAYTGFALIFPDQWWVAPLNLISATEGFRSTLHRIFGVVLIAAAFHHLWFLVFSPRGREQRREFWPRLKDVTDLRENLRFYIRGGRRPDFGRFSYIEKTEYWALVWGTVVMVVTGLVLWFEDIALTFMPLWLWEVFATVHFYEAILAVLAIVVWHFYFVFINPDEAPMSLTWLTGRMSLKEMAKVHPEEFSKLLAAREAERAASQKTDTE